jgi:hypothetical protein|tara:strand:- start:198 stop:392 length:195 start_codon:yes stop_codon:yes gene_type:complete
MQTEQMRLQQFKKEKGRRLEEMEAKVNQYQLFEKVNVEKLISVLSKQQVELEKLKNDNSNSNSR